MLFNSIQFVIFFLCTTLFYYLLPHRARWALLLFASCFFYMSYMPIYITILGVTILIDYIAGCAIEKTSGTTRRALLVVSIVATCVVLCIFKYFNFINDNIRTVFASVGVGYAVENISIALPIGLSFHTFQSLSYVIEVYRGHQKAERNFGIYSLYVMFYPQLVAGPIERPQNMLHQFYRTCHFDATRVANGLKLIFWGLFKKLVIADRLSIYVDAVYNNYPSHSGSSLLVASIFFAFQIYCDFSGYSDIASGCARVLGFNLMINFRNPYFATSVRTFWTRWHISLSTWFKDYVYFPLGGNKVSASRWAFNIMVVFTLSGIWHGANWTFVCWGLLHGMMLVLARPVGNCLLYFAEACRINPKSAFVSTLLCFFTFMQVTLAWVFFRAESLEQATAVLLRIFTNTGHLFVGQPSSFAYSILAIGILIAVDANREFFHGRYSLFEHSNIHVRTFSYAAACVVLSLIGVFDGGQFIYFQF